MCRLNECFAQLQRRQLLAALCRAFGRFRFFTGSFGDAMKRCLFTRYATFGIALDQPGDISRKRLPKSAFGCNLLTRIVNRVF